ncbi:MAG: N-acetylmuramoyl-L-alanine amidase [Thermodesulfovibrionales bacterium]|nr:N-acetylmuramoyl-L-alanine amidase [Thermodesulfovibrionales bacterium]
MTRRNFIFSLLSLKVFLSSFFSSKNAHASDPVDVKDIRQWSSKGYTRVAVDLSAPVEFSNKRISNPDRLYFDLKNTKISKEINTMLPVGDGILKTVRAAQFNQDTVRVVLDLEEIRDFKAFILEEPAKLIIDVYGKKPVKNNNDVLSQKTIVIDAGHGGHDPGAVGPTGLYEKDVVLDIALKLRDSLSKNNNLKIYLTREKDVFIPLVERTAFANSKHADLFISIHTNASPNRSARGIETYLLNWTNDDEAIRVAARENQISLKQMKEQMNKYKKSYVDVMLNSLERDLKRDKSLNLAGNIQKSVISVLSKKYDDIHDRHIKNALFYVLMGAEMPSVLAEVSFISNPVEEKLLSKEAYRDYIAKAMADGVNTYAAAMPSEQKVAGLKKSAGAER